MNVLKRIALIAAPLAVLGGVAAGATSAHAALIPTRTDVTYTVASAVLATAPGDVTPANGQAVQLDLTAAVRAAGVATADVDNRTAQDIVFLEAHGLDAGQVSTVHGDTLIRLFVTGSHPSARTFSLAYAPHGTALIVPPFTVNDVAGTTGSAFVQWLRFIPPYVYNGHTITVDTNRAVVGWNFGPGVSCALVQIVGFGFGTAGSPHVGYTCFNASVDPLDHGAKTNKGYLTGLHPHQTYALKITPATHVTDRADARPLPGARSGYVDVFTLAS